MFKSSRKKITVSITVSLVLLFVVTVSVIMMASYSEIRIRNTEMLERYVQLYSLERQPGKLNDMGIKPEFREITGEGPAQRDPSRDLPELPPDIRPDYQLSTFYSVAFDDNGNVLSVDDGGNGIFDEDKLAEMAGSVLSDKKTTGRIDDLFYMKCDKSEYIVVAFLDNTVTENSMKMILRNVIIVGIVAIAVLFLISLLLSKMIIKPLEENDRQQKQFISDASHELKTPVAVIGANSDILAREVGENEWLANIRYENERMGELVLQLLNLSRAEKTETPMETVDLSRVVTGETLAFESFAYDQGKVLKSDIDAEIKVNGNAGQLSQLVSVLLDNAVRHSTGSGIEVSLYRQGLTAILSVTNDSDEIDPDKREHLFDRFYRVDEARNSEGNHYGLGLSIAKAVSEKHGGSIKVSCHDGKVVFTVTLPVRR